jgi:CBS domain-containing protein
MSTSLITVEPAATIAEAATLMGGRHAGSALVVEGGRLVGIFTERDVLRALASEFDASRHSVAEWMTSNLATIGPDAGVREALDLMLQSGFRHLPVKEGEQLIGIVSIRDLTLHAERERGREA